MTRLSFCETLPATTISKEHVRRVGPEGLMLGGGAPGQTLCGRDLRAGWDLEAPVTPHAIHVGGVDGYVCLDCAAEATRILSA